MRFAHYGVLWKWLLCSRRSDATAVFLVLALLPVSAQPPPAGPHEENGDGEEDFHEDDHHHDHGRGDQFLEEWLGGFEWFCLFLICEDHC